MIVIIVVVMIIIIMIMIIIIIYGVTLVDLVRPTGVFIPSPDINAV